MSIPETSLEYLRTAARAADDKKAENIVAIDVSEALAIVDSFLIASAPNERQVASIVDAIEDELQDKHDLKPLRREGRAEGRWPDYMPTFLRAGAVSSLAVPIPAAQLAAAALNVYAPVADAFTDADRQVVGEFAAYAGAALINMDALQDARELAENLQKAMEFRSVIEQAKGILIERRKLTAEQAFRLLADASMHTNRKLRAVAEDLVLTGDLNP